MDKEKMPVIVGIFVVGYIIFFIANFILLKATVKWPEQPPADTLQQEEPSEELSLTWDISGKTGPPKELEKEFQRKQREQTLSIVDSIVTKETQPLKQQVAETRRELEGARETVGDLQQLLTELAATADSIDQVKAKRLSKMIEAMKPAEAATIMKRLSARANAELLLKMRQRQAAKILAALPRERAAEVARYLSQAYARSSI